MPASAGPAAGRAQAHGSCCPQLGRVGPFLGGDPEESYVWAGPLPPAHQLSLPARGFPISPGRPGALCLFLPPAWSPPSHPATLFLNSIVCALELLPLGLWETEAAPSSPPSRKGTQLSLAWGKPSENPESWRSSAGCWEGVSHTGPPADLWNNGGGQLSGPGHSPGLPLLLPRRTMAQRVNTASAPAGKLRHGGQECRRPDS